ncbi:MAG: hypothetical protein LUE11_05300 [Clostridia bacterium]|nr:hypothetical protein [Clostridia bacterium]
MTNEQIAHDLAITKLSGSDLSTEELIAKYKEEYQSILKILKSQTVKWEF